MYMWADALSMAPGVFVYMPVYGYKAVLVGIYLSPKYGYETLISHALRARFTLR